MLYIYYLILYALTLLLFLLRLLLSKPSGRNSFLSGEGLGLFLVSTITMMMLNIIMTNDDDEDDLNIRAAVCQQSAKVIIQGIWSFFMFLDTFGK